MNQYIKILFFIFLFHSPFLISHFSFAQTDTLPPISDTLVSPLPVTDTLTTLDTIVNPTIDTSLINTGTENNLDDTILPVMDTLMSSATDTIQSIDTMPKPVPPKKIIAQFDTNNLIIQPGEIISKLLQVINGTDKQVIFTINLTYPGGWKQLTNPEKQFSLNPGDTFFIPVRIVPQGKIQGNTKYLIFAYIINENNVPVAGAHFLAEKQKIISWEINVSPDPKIYLLNNETTVGFSINLFNSGNEQQELTLDMSNYRHDRIALMDTNERILKKPFYSFNLQQQEDTNFYFRARYTQGLRNYKLIDHINYRPNFKGEAQKYSIFAQSRESAITGKGSIFKSKKIDIIRLNDEEKINPYNQAVLPMTMEANISNILVGQPVMNILFNGSTVLNNGAYLTYFANTYFSTYFANYQFFQNSFFNIGYYDKKFNVQAGNNIGGGLGGGGTGISGNYFIDPNQTVGGFFARGTRFINAERTSGGAYYQYSISKFRIKTEYSHISNSSLKLNNDFLRNDFSYSINPKHNVGIGAILSRNVSTLPNNSFTKFGYILNGNYSGAFFNNMLRSNLSGTYSSKDFGGFNQGTWWNVNHFSNFSVKKWTATMNNMYQYRENFTPLLQKQININNIISFSRKISKSTVSPQLFYNITNFDNRPSGGALSRFHSRGIGINYGIYEQEDNKMMGINLMSGYNRALDIPDLKDYFFFRAFYVFRYRVWSGNIRYNYGSIAPTDLRFLSGIYPQTIGASLNYQYQFRNPHFVLDNNFTYNYLNTFEKHSFGYTPQLYYFTNNGWRFYVQPGYYFSTSNVKNQYVPNKQGEAPETITNVSHSFLLNAGVRKEFGIPLFWRKEKFPTLIFLAFIDHNGNNKQDQGEVTLENVVVKLGEWETLTNEKGLVTFRNVFGDSTYAFSAFSLVDLKGYFPNIPANITAVKDSLMFVPFVKGVKIHGNVYLDREKITPGVEKPIDLTGIKITALNGKAVHTLTDGKGDFSFYVPFGKYTISMDEKVLGDRFTILQNNIELELDQKTESIFLTFYIVEKRRKITVKKFNGNGDRIKDSDTTITPKPKTLEDLQKEEELKKQKEGLSPGAPGKGDKEKVGKEEGKKEEKGTKSQVSSEPIDKSQIKFKVQIGAYNSDVPNDIVEKIKSLPDIKESMTEEGLTRYTAGDFSDYEAAQALRQELINKGISSDTTFVIIIADYKGRVFSADEAKELLKD